MKVKNLIALILLFALTACSGTSSVMSSVEEKTENLSDVYETLPKENAFYMGRKENIERFLEHGTGILVLGFPECPWCRAYLPIFNEVLQENDMQAMYYNIRVDKTEDRPFYDTIAERIEDLNDTGEEIIRYDNDGNSVIYMPLVLFVDNGRITFFNNETSMEDSEKITPEEYWKDEEVQRLKAELKEPVLKIRDAQEANDAQGCDKGCQVRPGENG